MVRPTVRPRASATNVRKSASGGEAPTTLDSKHDCDIDFSFDGRGSDVIDFSFEGSDSDVIDFTFDDRARDVID